MAFDEAAGDDPLGQALSVLSAPPQQQQADSSSGHDLGEDPLGRVLDALGRPRGTPQDVRQFLTQHAQDAVRNDFNQWQDYATNRPDEPRPEYSGHDWSQISAAIRENFPGQNPEQYRDAYVQHRRGAFREFTANEMVRQQLAQPPNQAEFENWWWGRAPVIGTVRSFSNQHRSNVAAERIAAGNGSWQDYVNYAQAATEARRAGNQDWIAQAFDASTMMPAFANEYALTQGLGSAFGEAAAGGARGLLPQAWQAGRTADVLGHAVHVLGQAQVQALPRTLASAAQQAAPEVQLGGEHGFDIISHGNWYDPVNLARGYTREVIEATTEQLGEYFGPGLSAVANTRAGARVTGVASGILSRVMRATPGLTAEQFSAQVASQSGRVAMARRLAQGFARNTGFHGLPQEMLEERLNEVLIGVAGLSERQRTEGRQGENVYGATGNTVYGLSYGAMELLGLVDTQGEAGRALRAAGQDLLREGVSFLPFMLAQSGGSRVIARAQQIYQQGNQPSSVAGPSQVPTPAPSSTSQGMQSQLAEPAPIQANAPVEQPGPPAPPPGPTPPGQLPPAPAGAAAEFARRAAVESGRLVPDPNGDVERGFDRRQNVATAAAPGSPASVRSAFEEVLQKAEPFVSTARQTEMRHTFEHLWTHGGPAAAMNYVESQRDHFGLRGQQTETVTPPAATGLTQPTVPNKPAKSELHTLAEEHFGNARPFGDQGGIRVEANGTHHIDLTPQVDGSVRIDFDYMPGKRGANALGARRSLGTFLDVLHTNNKAVSFITGIEGRPAIYRKALAKADYVQAKSTQQGMEKWIPGPTTAAGKAEFARLMGLGVFSVEHAAEEGRKIDQSAVAQPKADESASGATEEDLPATKPVGPPRTAQDATGGQTGQVSPEAQTPPSQPTSASKLDALRAALVQAGMNEQQIKKLTEAVLASNGDRSVLDRWVPGSPAGNYALALFEQFHGALEGSAGPTGGVNVGEASPAVERAARENTGPQTEEQKFAADMARRLNEVNAILGKKMADAEKKAADAPLPQPKAKKERKPRKRKPLAERSRKEQVRHLGGIDKAQVDASIADDIIKSGGGSLFMSREGGEEGVGKHSIAEMYRRLQVESNMPPIAGDTTLAEERAGQPVSEQRFNDNEMLDHIFGWVQGDVVGRIGTEADALADSHLRYLEAQHAAAEELAKTNGGAQSAATRLAGEISADQFAEGHTLGATEDVDGIPPGTSESPPPTSGPEWDNQFNRLPGQNRGKRGATPAERAAVREGASTQSNQLPGSPGGPGGGAPPVPGANPTPHNADTVIGAIATFLAPTSRGQLAGTAAGIIRHHNAILVRNGLIAQTALQSASDFLEKWVEREQDPQVQAARFRQFTDAIEKGQIATLPKELQPFATAMRELTQGRTDGLLARQIINDFIDNYFGHLWTAAPGAPPASPDLIGKMFSGRRPLAGKESFKKGRSIPTYGEGLDLGLVPVSWNPAKLALLNLREMDKSIMAHDVKQELAANGLWKYVPLGQKAPEGWRSIDDKSARVFAPPQTSVMEIYDKRQMDALMEFAEKELNLNVTTATRGLAGAGQAITNPTGKDEIIRRFASPEEVLIHEIGHIIANRYGLNAWGSHPKFAVELNALANLRASGQVSQEYRDYLQQDDERVANLFAGYLHAPELTQQVAPQAFAALDAFLQSRPELAALRDVKPGLELGHREQMLRLAGPMLVGNYYAPEEVALLLQNHLTPGLRGNAAFDVLREGSGALNNFQLGFSAFHAAFVLMDTQISALGLAFQYASQGKLGSAVRHAIGGLVPGVASWQAWNAASPVLKEYYAPGSQGAAATAMVDELLKAGGRVKMDDFYGADHWQRFRDAVKDVRGGEWKRAGGALYNALPAFSELAAKPIMQVLVPRMKIGVMAQLAKFEMERVGPGATIQQQRAALGRAWDSVENRLGQMTYDNLFWNRTMKDILMVGVRSVGWNLGTIREIGGGIKDIPESIRGIRSGEGITPRTAYLVALPMVTALYGSMIQMLLTGKPPEEPKDYFFPRTGRQRPDGTAERLSLPSYMRDVAAVLNRADEGPIRVASNLWGMAKHKLNPGVAIVAEMLNNENFFGRAIYDPQDKVTTQALDLAKHLIGAFEPMAVRNYRQQRERGAGPAEAASGFFGLTAAPSYITHTGEQQRAAEQMRTNSLTPLERRRREQNPDLDRFPVFSSLYNAAAISLRDKSLSDADRSALTSWQMGVAAMARGDTPARNPFTSFADLPHKTAEEFSGIIANAFQGYTAARPTPARGEPSNMYRMRVGQWEEKVAAGQRLLERIGITPAQLRQLLLEQARRPGSPGGSRVTPAESRRLGRVGV